MSSRTGAAIALTRRRAGLIARMGRLRAAAEQAAYVATLKERFGRRRNFVKLLA